ncbi:MAG: rhodanese-like domain-containing protein [Saprospiraceae bacterium]|nr:rhodanese-like domain-containing protein [Saprospiraceae bacterium]
MYGHYLCKKNKSNMDKTLVIDVRTPGEFLGGHVAGSINIPLNEIHLRVDDIKNMGNKEIILCCASGNRSGQATAFLKSQGIACVNGGSWFSVNALV